MEFSGTKLKEASFEECKEAALDVSEAKGRPVLLLWFIYMYMYWENNIMHR